MDADIRRKVERLIRTSAYRDPKDPEHEEIKERVRKVFEIEHEGEVHGRRPSPIVIDTTPRK